METTAESGVLVIDEAYEFSAPRFFDFINEETEEDRINAQLWFESALTHAPSPFTMRIKMGRSVKVESICDFTEAIELPQKPELMTATVTEDKLADPVIINDPTRSESVPFENKPQVNEDKDVGCIPSETKRMSSLSSSPIGKTIPIKDDNKDAVTSVVQDQTNCTPKVSHLNSARNDLKKKNHQSAQKIASIIRNPSALRSETRSQLSHNKCPKPATAKREASLKSTVATPSFAQENQAGKRQKLEGGKSRQILNIINPTNLPHKSRPGIVNNLFSLCSSTTDKPRKEDRKIYVREPAPAAAAPFVSTAEMMRKFQLGTRDIGNAASIVQMKSNHLTLTRPKEPELVTSQRIRPAHVKSSAEIEEEMMAKIPKFKARPLRKKILQAPTLPPLPRNTPRLIEFKEFHLETMERAVQHADASTIATTTESSVPTQQIDQWKPRLTAPKSPLLHTSLRSRPPSVKSWDELQKEELENVPKFKARPLNRKIFDSKGDLGIFYNTKKQVTVPQEFHFKIDERIPPPTTAVADMFDKMSLCSESSTCSKQIPRNTRPNPFHLLTEERGAEKEKKFVMELAIKEITEEKARVHKGLPYPYTTDYPVIPPKPEAKQCTKPEPFQLESVLRHEEEMQRKMEERKKMEKEEAEMKIFKAQPIMTKDPVPVPEKVRVPLTEVQRFNLQVDHRAVERAEFDNKIKEKEQIHKRYREEAESAKLMEEEKALKQLRRTMVPRARPVPNFSHPFMPQKSCKERTTPKSPRLKIDRRREEKTKRSIVTSSGATAASNIR